jgi:hypothetical protein
MSKLSVTYQISWSGGVYTIDWTHTFPSVSFADSSVNLIDLGSQNNYFIFGPSLAETTLDWTKCTTPLEATKLDLFTAILAMKSTTPTNPEVLNDVREINGKVGSVLSIETNGGGPNGKQLLLTAGNTTLEVSEEAVICRDSQGELMSLLTDASPGGSDISFDRETFFNQAIHAPELKDLVTISGTQGNWLVIDESAVKILDSTESTDLSTASLVTSGGLSVNKDIRIGGSFHISDFNGGVTELSGIEQGVINVTWKGCIPDEVRELHYTRINKLVLLHFEPFAVPGNNTTNTINNSGNELPSRLRPKFSFHVLIPVTNAGTVTTGRARFLTGGGIQFFVSPSADSSFTASTSNHGFSGFVCAYMIA